MCVCVCRSMGHDGVRVVSVEEQHRSRVLPGPGKHMETKLTLTTHSLMQWQIQTGVYGN